MRNKLLTLGGGALVALGLVLIPVSAAVAEATCTTFNAASEPATSFRAGEKLTVRGTGFAPRSIVLVSLIQGSRSIDLDRPAATDLGAFTAADLSLPLDMVSGKASLRAIDARGSATCGITLLAAVDAGEDTGMGPLFVLWAVLLGIAGIGLGVLTYRRWKTQKIDTAMEQLGWQAPVSDDTEDHPVFDPPMLEPLPLRRAPAPSVPLPLPAPRERVSAQVGRRAAMRPPEPSDVPAAHETDPSWPEPAEPAEPGYEGDPDEWYYGGERTGRAMPWSRDRAPQAPRPQSYEQPVAPAPVAHHPSPVQQQAPVAYQPAPAVQRLGRPVERHHVHVERPPAPVEEPDLDLDPDPLGRYGYLDDELPEPPATESGSEAIERLRREVQTWKRA